MAASAVGYCGSPGEISETARLMAAPDRPGAAPLPDPVLDSRGEKDEGRVQKRNTVATSPFFFTLFPLSLVPPSLIPSPYSLIPYSPCPAPAIVECLSLCHSVS